MSVTYNRATFLAARTAWDSGQFGSEWAEIRRLAGEAGYLYPPSGNRHDDRDAEEPSQRAIVYAQLRDNPTELRRIVANSRSWSQVVDRIIGLETRLRQDAELSDRDAEWDRERRPSYREAVTSIAAILTRIGDSA